MPASPFFSGRIPQSLCDAIEEYRQQTNESKTEILIKALSSYINHPVEPAAALETSRMIEALEKKFEGIVDQKIYALKSELAAKSTILDPVEQSLPEPVKQSPPEPASEIEKLSSQIPLILEGSTAQVIKVDNSVDNTEDNQPSQVIKVDNSVDNTEDNQPSKTFLGTMKTLKLIALPGLEDEDPKKMQIKLNNSMKPKIKTVQIGSYAITLSETVKEAFPGKRRELLWDVYKNENKTPALVISHDNNGDN